MFLGTKHRIKLPEKVWGLSMSKQKWMFYENQKTVSLIDYCNGYADKK